MGMETLHFSEKANRQYKRRFDHDQARTLREHGFDYDTISKMMGVSDTAVRRVCDPVFAAALAARSKAFYEDSCEMCGKPCLSPRHKAKWGRPGHDGRALCVRCRSDTKRLRLRFDELGNLAAVRCVTCKQWQQPERFGRGVRHREVRDGGIHTSCRSCLTMLRQDYRLRHKVPCKKCGTPVLPPNEKGRRGKDTGLCGPCWHRSRVSA